MKSRCPKCDQPVTAALIGQNLLLLSPETDINGTVLVVEDRATFLAGHLLKEARQRGLSIYSRHGVVCREFWK